MMTQTSTDRICKALEEKAIKRLRDSLQIAANEFNEQIGLGGTCDFVKVENDKGETVNVRTDKFLKAVVEQFTEKRSSAACAKEVTDFLNGFSNIQQQFYTIEQYLEEHHV